MEVFQVKICRNGHNYVPFRWPSGKWKTCKQCSSRTYLINKLNNPKAGSLRTIKWQRENPEKYNAKQRKWCKNNLDKFNAKWHRRNAAKKNRTPKWLTKHHYKLMEMYSTQAKYLSEVTGMKWTVDHIIPLQGKNVSGLHVPWNLRVIPASENYSKGNKIGVYRG